MTPPLVVRDARPDDLDTIVEFNARLAAETEGKTLDRAVLTQGVAAALAEPDRLRYWVAELLGSEDTTPPRPPRIVGQAAITREWSDWRNGWAWWLQSVYVREGHRGRGVFRALYRHIHAEGLAQPDVIGLRLYVDHANDPAQSTYRALGMRPGGYHVYEQLWADRFSSPDPG